MSHLCVTHLQELSKTDSATEARGTRSTSTALSILLPHPKMGQSTQAAQIANTMSLQSSYTTDFFFLILIIMIIQDLQSYLDSLKGSFESVGLPGVNASH